MSKRINNALATIVNELDSMLPTIDVEQIDGFIAAITDAQAIFIAGAGRSGMLLRCFAMRLMHMGKNVYVVGEIVTPAIRKGDLLIIGSGSGETGSLLIMAQKAKDLGAHLALITTNPKSRIGAFADGIVHIDAPTPKSALPGSGVKSSQPMGNLFEQSMFLLLDAVVMQIMETSGKTPDAMFARHANLE